MRIDKPLWHEGLILTQQHFQQQDRWMNFMQNQIASTVIAAPWGCSEVRFDEEAIGQQRLKLASLKLRLPDGSMIDTRLTDPLPPARELDQARLSDYQSLIVYAALPLMNANGDNCHFDEAQTALPRRFYREFVNVCDLNGSGETEIAAERRALRLLFDFENHANDTVCAVARLIKDKQGLFQIDDRFVPPCLTLSGHPLHTDRISRIAGILQSKSDALSVRKRERIDDVTEYGVADVTLFWLLNAIHTCWPQLRFLAAHPQQPPERLYCALAQLASVLMTFSTTSRLADIPGYQHEKADDVFAKLESLIRNSLDAMTPSRVVHIALTRKNASTWAARFDDERLCDRTDFYLSVNASLPAFELVDQVTRLCKIGSPDDVQHIVNAALSGIPLKGIQRLPAAIPVRLDNFYFSLDASDPAHIRMLAARACEIYLPSAVPDPSVDLYAVLPR